MKRFLALSLFLLTAASAFAQIRIEKRHYNKGWYISRSHSVKANADTTVRKAKAIAHASAKTHTDASALTSEISETQIVPAASPVQAPKTVTAKKKITTAEKTIQPARLSSAPSVKKNAVTAAASFSLEAKSVSTQAADPGDSFWVYLFDSLRPFFIAVGIIILAVLAAFIIYGLITNPLGTIVGLLVLIFCPEIFLWS